MDLARLASPCGSTDSFSAITFIGIQSVAPNDESASLCFLAPSHAFPVAPSPPAPSSSRLLMAPNALWQKRFPLVFHRHPIVVFHSIMVFPTGEPMATGGRSYY